MTKQCIEKTISDIDYQKLFSYIFSPANIWNMSDDKSDEEESLNDYTNYPENLCFVISKLWTEREKHINTSYDVTGCMLCIITHTRDYLLKIKMETIGTR